MIPLSDNLDGYLDPVLYDLENPDFEPEGPFYLELARQAGGPVLEFGCGNGRMTIPLAEQSLDLTGLDAVPAILERAKAKAGDLPIQYCHPPRRKQKL